MNMYALTLIRYPAGTIRWSLNGNNQCYGLKTPQTGYSNGSFKIQHQKTGHQKEEGKTVALDGTQNLPVYIQVMSLEDKLQK